MPKGLTRSALQRSIEQRRLVAEAAAAGASQSAQDDQADALVAVNLKRDSDKYDETSAVRFGANSSAFLLRLLSFEAVCRSVALSHAPEVMHGFMQAVTRP